MDFLMIGIVKRLRLFTE